MSGVSASELAQEETLKTSVTRSDPESQLNAPFILYEPLPIIKKKSLGAGVCKISSISANIWTDLHAVHTTDRRFRHDSDDSITFSHGMARCHNHQCLHRELLLHRGIWTRSHSPMGVGYREWARILDLQRFWCGFPVNRLCLIRRRNTDH